MEHLPLLTDLIDDAVEFERLLKKLLMHKGRLNRYVFESLPRYGGRYPRCSQENYPGMKCPVAFYSIWSKSTIESGAASTQVKESLEFLLKSEMKYESYVLITLMP